MNEHQLDHAKELAKGKVDELAASLQSDESLIRNSSKKERKKLTGEKILQVDNLQVSFKTYGGEAVQCRVFKAKDSGRFPIWKKAEVGRSRFSFKVALQRFFLWQL